MSSVLPNASNVPIGFQIDGYVYPQFIYAQRAPTSNDIYNAGTRWYNTVTSLIYETTGNGSWPEGGVPSATLTVPGIVTIASNTGPNNWTAGTGVAYPAAVVPNAADVYNYIQTIVLAGAGIATQTAFGLTKLSTDANAVAATANNPGVTAFVVQPSNLVAIFAAPQTIGNTTPNTGAFTTLGATTVTFTAGGSWQSNGTAINIATNADNDAINIGTAGTRTIIVGDSTSTTNIALNVGTGALNLGTDATAHTSTLGSTTTTSTTNVQAGSGGIGIGTTATQQTITIGNITGSTNVVVNAGTGASSWTTTNGTWTLSTGTGAIGLGTDAAAKTVTVGNVTSTTQVVVNYGTTGLLMDGVGSSTVSLFPSQTSGTVTIGGTAQTAAGTITIGSSSAAASVLIGMGAGAATVTLCGGTAGANICNICNSATAATNTVNILSGAGSAGGGALHMADNGRVTAVTLANVAPAAARAVTFAGGAAAQNDVWAILGGANTAGTQSFSVLNGALNGSTNTFNVFSGVIASGTQTFNLFNGNASGGTLVANIYGGSANTTAGTLNLNTGTAAHILNVGSATSGAQTWTVGTGNFSLVGSGKTIGIANDAAANVVTVGSTTASASLTLQSGSGGNTLISGNVAATITIGNNAQTGKISIADSTAAMPAVDLMNGVAAGAQVLNIASGTSSTSAQTVNLLNGTTPGANTTLAIMCGAATAGTQALTILSSGATRAGTYNIGDGGAAHVGVIGSKTASASLTLQAGSGTTGLKLDATGNVQMVPVVVSAGALSVTNNNRVGQCVYTGQVTASGATDTYTISNTVISGTTQAILLTCDNLGSNDAQMTITRIKQSAGTLAVQLKNNGAAALNGDVHLTFWILN